MRTIEEAQQSARRLGVEADGVSHAAKRAFLAISAAFYIDPNKAASNQVAFSQKLELLTIQRMASSTQYHQEAAAHPRELAGVLLYSELDIDTAAILEKEVEFIATQLGLHMDFDPLAKAPDALTATILRVRCGETFGLLGKDGAQIAPEQREADATRFVEETLAAALQGHSTIVILECLNEASPEFQRAIEGAIDHIRSTLGDHPQVSINATHCSTPPSAHGSRLSPSLAARFSRLYVDPAFDAPAV